MFPKLPSKFSKLVLHNIICDGRPAYRRKLGTLHSFLLSRSHNMSGFGWTRNFDTLKCE